MTKPLSECSREELIEIIGSLKRQKKFGLVWEDKPEKVAEECKTKLPVLKEIEEKKILLGGDEPANLIIEGDNYHALSVLNYTHAGKIDVIYIDPPYNTGNKDFVYNDQFIDKEDAFSHSKWLSFMDKRLRLAKNLLSDDGVIFISIDDNEQAELRMLCDEIFGENNFVAPLIWNTKNAGKGVPPVRMITSIHEYILVYTKKASKFKFGGIIRDTSDFDNPDNDPRGLWRKEAVVSTISKKKFEIQDPKTGNKFFRAWAFSKESIEKMIKDDRIIFPKNEKGTPLQKKFFDDYTNDSLPITTQIGTFQTRKATSDLMRIFDNNKVFDFPKPVDLIKFVIEQSTKDGIILDFFAGSGTTGQSVLELNKEDGGHRHFILCTSSEEKDNHIAEEVTYPRIKTVVTGTRIDGSKYSDGIPANLRYFKTDFVEKERSTDATREKLVERSADMIRIRENTFEEVKSESINRYYQSKDAFVAVIFDPFEIKNAWAEIEKLNTEEKLVKLYIFSYSRDTSAFTEEIPKTTLKWEAVPIPESILQVYKRLFGGKK